MLYFLAWTKQDGSSRTFFHVKGGTQHVIYTGRKQDGRTSHSRLLITMSLPMMVSMLVQALYNIVDSMFVAQLSEDALTAVSLVYPVQLLMIAVSSGTGVDQCASLPLSGG